MDLDAIEEDTFLNVEPDVDEASKSSQKATQLRPTLLSTISELITSFDEKYPKTPAPSTLHGFSPKPPDTEILESILHASGVIATTLASHIPSGDERHELRSREYTNHADAWFQVSLSTSPSPSWPDSLIASVYELAPNPYTGRFPTFLH